MAIINRQMLRLALVNLVNNAFDACSEGDVVTLSATLTASQLEIAVNDSGCGMAQEQIARATELFYTTKAKGSGIGLALIAKMLERAHGKLTLHSEPGNGTQAVLTIPQENLP